MDQFDTQASSSGDSVRRADEAAMIQEALDDVAAGRTISMEAMLNWVRSLGTESELPEPEPDQV